MQGSAQVPGERDYAYGRIWSCYGSINVLFVSGTGHVLSSMYKGYISLLGHFTTWTHLKNGGIFQLDHNLFGRIPVDHTIQKTANKEAPIQGG